MPEVSDIYVLTNYHISCKIFQKDLCRQSIKFSTADSLKKGVMRNYNVRHIYHNYSLRFPNPCDTTVVSQPPTDNPKLHVLRSSYRPLAEEHIWKLYVTFPAMQSTIWYKGQIPSRMGAIRQISDYIYRHYKHMNTWRTQLDPITYYRLWQKHHFPL